MMLANLWGPALSGFSLGAGLIIAIGAQNAYVLRLGIVKQHVFIVALVCALSDMALIIAGVGGFGTFVKSAPMVLDVVTVFGAVFLLTYGILAFKRALHPTKMAMQEQTAPTRSAAIMTVLALTFLNPHVYLDTVVLLGGLSAQYEGTGRIAYATGASLASFVWFFSLGYGARLFAPLFAKSASWRVLDSFIAIIMWSLAIKLVYSHFQLSGFFNPAGS